VFNLEWNWKRVQNYIGLLPTFELFMKLLTNTCRVNVKARAANVTCLKRQREKKRVREKVLLVKTLYDREVLVKSQTYSLERMHPVSPLIASDTLSNTEDFSSYQHNWI